MIERENLSNGVRIRLHGGNLGGHLEGTTFEIVRVYPEGDYRITALNGPSRTHNQDMPFEMIVERFFIINESLQSIRDNWQVRVLDDGIAKLINILTNDCIGQVNNDKGTGKISTSFPKEMTLDEIKSIFKYVPISVNNYKGFFWNGKAVLRKPIVKKDRRGRPTPYYEKNDDGTTKERTAISDFPEEKLMNHVSLMPILNQCKFKIKDYVKSSKVFRYTSDKKEMVGKVYTKNDIKGFSFKEQLKEDGDKYNTVIFNNAEGKGMKFLLEDVEIIYPNIKGYNMPKNREVKTGCTVKIIDNRRFRIVPKSTVGVVTNILTVGNKHYADVVLNGEIIRENVKKFKVL